MFKNFTDKQKILFMFIYIIVLNLGINAVLPYPQHEEDSFAGYGIFVEQASVRSSHYPIFNQVRIFYDATTDGSHPVRIYDINKVSL